MISNESITDQVTVMYVSTINVRYVFRSCMFISLFDTSFFLPIRILVLVLIQLNSTSLIFGKTIFAHLLFYVLIKKLRTTNVLLLVYVLILHVQQKEVDK